MLNVFTGIVGVLMLCAFLAFYILRVDALPLWIIMVLCAGMALYDLLIEGRSSNNGGKG